MADDIEEDLVVGVELGFIVGGLDFVVSFRIVKSIQFEGDALDGAESAGGGGDPAIVFPGGLEGCFTLC